MPNLDPVIKETATWETGFTAFPKGPVVWKETDGGKRLECIAVGSEQQQDRSVKVCSIPRAFPEEHAGSDEVLDSGSVSAGDAAETIAPTAPAEAVLEEIEKLQVSDDMTQEVLEKVTADAAAEPKTSVVA